MSEEKRGVHHHDPPPPLYGTFQGVANYHPPAAVGLPRPVPPPGFAGGPSPPQYYVHGYHAVPGYVVAEGRPVREHHRLCCGIGIGWFLFIIGFFLAGIPWYVGALILICSRVEPREKPGHVACAIAAIVATIVVMFGLTRVDDD